MADDTPPPTVPPAPPVPTPGPDFAARNAPLDIVDELRDSYLTYAQSVMVSRALPDVRDGLKPSQRRILVAMRDLGLTPGSATSKCAGIIGETMKRYHPHGDASIYDTLVRMAQDWVMRQRLVHGQGNFGSVAGLPPAAHRYTEARLTPAAAELLEDLDAETVDFIDNYDGKYREPLVLPGKFPNLLVNGSDGIAVGMATDIPPHNLREVCVGLIKLIDDPGVTLGELLEVIPGPDFPTGGIVMGRQGIARGYLGERSRMTLRARAEVVEEGKSSHILIREVPYQVTRNKLMADIAEAAKDGGKDSPARIAGISAVTDESSARTGEPVRIVVELKRGIDPHMVLNQLYQYTPLQKTVSVGMLALVDGRPQFLTLKEMMQKYLDHRVQVIRRKTQYLLREAKRRGHTLEGQLIAISSLDEVIEICRRSPSRAEAKERLQGMAVAPAVMERAIGGPAFEALTRELGAVEAYRMTEAQAEAVVRMQLGQLAALESDAILKEYTQLRGDIRGYEELLADDGRVNAVIRSDMAEMAAKYGTDRRTEITDSDSDVDLEDLIADEPCVVTISHGGFVKRMPTDTYRVQARGGRGVRGGLKEDDFVEHFFAATTKSVLLIFTDRGQCHQLKVYRLPQANRDSPGRAIANVLQLRPEEKIAGVIPVRSFDPGVFLMMATRQGLVKKSALLDYGRPRQGGIIGINLEEGDALIDVCLTRPGDEVVLSTRTGMAIRFGESDARAMGRGATGVWGIKMKPGADELVGMVVADPDGCLLTVCANGYGKRTPFGPNTAAEAVDDAEADADAPAAETVADEAEAGEPAERGGGTRYRRQRRGGKGVRDIRTSDRNGPVVGIAAVRDGDEIMLITTGGMVVRSKVDAVRLTGRNAQGVRVINLKAGDKLATVAPVAPGTAPADADESTAISPDGAAG